MEEDKIKYLEMIQNIVNRMANNSFMLKGWTVTIVAGIFSLSYERINFAIYLLVYSVIILFWILDSYYLQLERLYRSLYEKSVVSEEVSFCLKLLPPTMEDKTTFVQVLLSKTELGFYVLLALIISLVFILM